MLTKDEIIKSLVIEFSEEDECYVAESPIWTGNIGCGDTPDEAKSEFAALLDTGWPDYEAGNHAMNLRKVGRPATGKVSVNTRLEPTLRDELDEIANLLKVTRGEVIEALVKKYGRKLKSV